MRSVRVPLSALIAVAVACLVLDGCHGGRDRVGPTSSDAQGWASPLQTTLLGDMDGDGLPSVSDGIAILRIVVGFAQFTPVADCDGDGVAGVADAIMVLRCVVGLLEWPIGYGGRLGPDGQWLLLVSAGSFTMGNDGGVANERPAHQVSLDDFWIGRCEVTNEQYAAFLNETVAPDVGTWLEVSDEDCGVELIGGSYQAKNGLEDYPVVEVSWHGARAYCDHYGYALPTEAQWEYAARGPSGSEYPWGDVWDADRCCNTGNRGPGGKAAPVGSYLDGASWCGALDMAGNVWEWCADWYSATYYQVSPGENPPGPDDGVARVYRGGSWLLGDDFCRAARRVSGAPAITWDDGGFRVACGAEAR